MSPQALAIEAPSAVPLTLADADRYVPLLRRIAHHVTLQAQASVARVLEHFEWIDSLTARYNSISPETYDVAVALTELPHIFRTHIDTIPATVPYIPVAPRSLSPTTLLRARARSCPGERYWDASRSPWAASYEVSWVVS